MAKVHPGITPALKDWVSQQKMFFVAHRDVLDKWSDRKGPDGLTAYRREKNKTSIDGLRGYLPPAT